MKVFLDTNILIYAQTEGEKGEIARALLQQGGVISVQVLNEFANAMRNKRQTPWSQIKDALADILILLRDIQPISIETHTVAVEIASKHMISFYDALIVAAAISADCEAVYTEDMNSGAIINGVLISNPFQKR